MSHMSEHHEHQNHDKHAGHSPDMFKSKFWISLLLTIPTVLYSSMVQQWLGFRMPTFTGFEFIPAIFGTILFFYSGTVFLKSAVAEIKDRLPGMMTLISLAISVAFLYSIYTTIAGMTDGMDFWWELATLITIMILGHWMEMRSVMNAQGALNELAKLLPDEAELVSGDTTKIVPASQLKVGDIVLVRPGANVPIDGRVIAGESNVNESMITGESRPVHKTVGSEVIGGTVNNNGSFKIKVTKVGDATALAGIMRLVAEAQSSKSRTQILADKAAFYLTIVALTAAAITMVGWLLAGANLNFTLERVVTVLVIACPHALGLAVPLVTSISTTLAAKNGLLVRQRIALESARNIDVVLFDKTGTLTKGEQGVVDVWTTGGHNESEVLALAGAIEADSEHIIARAIVDKAKETGKLPLASKFKTLPGRGVQATVDGRTLYMGGPQLLNSEKIKLNEQLQDHTDRAGKEGKTVVYLVENGQPIAAFALTDVIREESRAAIKELKSNGIRVAMLTGDSQDVAAWVAKELKLDEYFAEVLPEHKADVVNKLQKDGSKVAMVGDGVNDAPALTQANIGIAIGAGTDVAIESAGIVLASSDPRGVAKIVRLSKASYRKMSQNLIWATGYNALAIPLAAGALAYYGFILAPAVGAVLMSISTIVVAVNAQFLRRLNLQEATINQ
jgi:P-type Cu2+ transporter